MKNLLKVSVVATIAVAMFSFYGCKKESPFWEPIKKDIINDALGVDFDFKLVELKVIDTVHVSESIDDWYLLNNDSGETNEECRKGVEELVDDMKSYYDQTGEEQSVNYLVWKRKLERIKELEKKQPNDIDYYVVFVHYQFEIELLDGRMTNIYRYYLLSPDMKPTNKMEEEDFDEMAKEYNSTPLLKYEFWMMQDMLD